MFLVNLLCFSEGRYWSWKERGAITRNRRRKQVHKLEKVTQMFPERASWQALTLALQVFETRNNYEIVTQ